MISNNNDCPTRCIKHISVFFCVLYIFLFLLGFITIAQAFSFLDIVSDPPSVELYVNGHSVGKTPVTGLEVPPGTVTIQAKKAGYGSATQKINIADGDVRLIKISLTPTEELTGKIEEFVTISQDKGSLVVKNTLGLVPVYIDNQNKGVGSIKVVDIAAGEHTLQIQKIKKIITIYKDYTLIVEANKDGIKVLNDLAEEEKKAKAEKENRDRIKAQIRGLNERIKLKISELDKILPGWRGAIRGLSNDYSSVWKIQTENEKRAAELYIEIVNDQKELSALTGRAAGDPYFREVNADRLYRQLNK